MSVEISIEIKDWMMFSRSYGTNGDAQQVKLGVGGNSDDGSMEIIKTGENSGIIIYKNTDVKWMDGRRIFSKDKKKAPLIVPLE